MTWLLVALLVSECIQLFLMGAVLYRLLAKHVLDPLGLDARMGRAEARLLVVESRYVDLVRTQTETERNLIDRLDGMRDVQSKMLGYMTSLESRVNAEAKERQEIASRLDQVISAVSNVASRFGGIETALNKVLDARPQGKE